MASFPGAIKTFATLVDFVDTYLAAHNNERGDEITAIETELGTDVAGSATDLKTRLIQSLAADGDLEFAAATELTIATGVITVTQNWHTVDGESDADDLLVTINGGAEGKVVFLRAENDARQITLDHLAGNIHCVGGRDIVLDDDEDYAILIYDLGLLKWLAIGMYTAAEIAAQVNETNIRYIILTAFGPGTAVTTGDDKIHFPVPADLNGYNLVEAHCDTPSAAGVTGTMFVQVRNITQAVNMLSGNGIEIDTGETSSRTAATPPSIDTANDDVATGDYLSIDNDAIHTTPAQGQIVTLGFRKP